MLKERREAARKVAENLFALEDALDVALARAGGLTASLPVARTEARVSALYGQDAMDSAAEALMLLVKARSKVLEAHQHLQETRCQLGLREVSVGDMVEKPKVAANRGALRIVA